MCRLYRKPEPTADEAWSGEQRATLASFRQHATRRFTADARRALPTLIDAALNLGRDDFRRDDYTYAGEPKMKITPGRDDDTGEPDRDALACVSPVDPMGLFRLPGILKTAKADRWWLKMLPYTGWQPRRTAFAAAG
mgnify:FL=1